MSLSGSHLRALAALSVLLLSACGDDDDGPGTVTDSRTLRTDSGTFGRTDSGPVPGTDGGPITGTDGGLVTGTDGSTPTPPAALAQRARWTATAMATRRVT